MTDKQVYYLKTKKFLREEAYFKKQEENLLKSLLAKLVVTQKNVKLNAA